MKRVTKNIEKFSEAIKSNLITLLISAFGFVAALSWNDAIRSWLDTFIQGEGVAYKFYAAILVTFLSVLVIYFISKFKSK